MRKYLKTENQKLDTKLLKLNSDKNVVKKKNAYYVDNKLLLTIRKNELEYSSYRYKPNNVDKVKINFPYSL